MNKYSVSITMLFAGAPQDSSFLHLEWMNNDLKRTRCLRRDLHFLNKSGGKTV